MPRRLTACATGAKIGADAANSPIIVFERTLAQLRSFGFAVEPTRAGNAARLIANRRSVGNAAARPSGVTFVAVSEWPGVRLASRLDVSELLAHEDLLAEALFGAAIDYLGQMTRLTVSSQPLACPLCGAGVTAGRRDGKVARWWRCKRFPLCAGVGPVTVLKAKPAGAPAHGPTARPIIRLLNGFVHEDASGIFHKLAPPQIDNRGYGFCPTCKDEFRAEFGETEM